MGCLVDCLKRFFRPAQAYPQLFLIQPDAPEIHNSFSFAIHRENFRYQLTEVSL